MSKEYSRRQLFRLGPLGFWREAAREEVSQEEPSQDIPPQPQQKPVRTRPIPTPTRPPGAIQPDHIFRSICTRSTHCRTEAACVEACPYQAITILAASAHGMHQHTPSVQPNDPACQRCTEQPCISACPVGALDKG